MPITGIILADAGNLGPIPWAILREFWAYGLIPAGTEIGLEGTAEPVAIERCNKLNRFPKALLSNIKWFREGCSAWQKCPNSQVQQNYLRELGWPFQTANLTYHQADFLRGKLEEVFPKRRRPFIDPENPWSPGSTKPLEGDYRSPQLPEKKQIAFLRFLGVDLPAYFSIESTSWEALNLIKEHSSLENFDEWAAKNYWENLPPTGRQIKTLKFFGLKNTEILKTRGQANSLLQRLFRNEKNFQNWVKYKWLTDDDDDSPDLRPFDPAEFEKLEFPALWEAEEYKWRQATWNFLNSKHCYHAPWLKFKDMEMIVEKWRLKDLLRQKLFDEFKRRFLEIIGLHFPETAGRERSRRNASG